MTQEWWYARGGRQHGPLPMEHLRDLLASGKLDTGTWFWTPGLMAWARAGTLPAFGGQEGDSRVAPQVRDAAPISLPTAIRPRLAGAWSRFWAQWLDIYLVKAILTLLLALAGFRLERDGTRFLGFLLVLPVGLMAQAALLATIGTTPGKAFLGLRVRRLDGRRPDLPTLVRRQWLLWLKGLALGLPLVDIATMYHAKERLAQALPTRWDDAAGTDVYQDEDRYSRLFFCAVLIFLIDGAGQVLANMVFHRFSVWHLS